MLVIVKESGREMSAEAAEIFANRLRKKPNLVVGFATGSTPVELYKLLIRMHKQEGLDFSKVTTFNLDEYVGLPPSHQASYARFMRKNLFEHLNIPEHSIHLPDGMADDVDAYCDWYEGEIQKAGGIDLQILGIGANGHIAFNEPGSSLGSRTRIKTLAGTTLRDNARFFKSKKDLPKYAITMGVGTIMDAKEILLLASGTGKADALRAAVEGPITVQCPASIVQLHRKVFIVLDRDAASKLAGSYPDSWHSSLLLER
ncbi:MAG TPA: glucosamine-6-phosphate deaminase [Bacteroidota bacterium]|nr:glucosamine-6-phosphate deaminase [Bacteroidota bacterium]